MNAKHLLFVCPFLLTLACNEKKEFGGAAGSAKLPDEKKIEQSEDAIASKSPSTARRSSGNPGKSNAVTADAEPVIPKCDVGESEIIDAKLLTQGVDLSKRNQIIKYEISVLSCKDGTVVPINDQSIAFDLDLQYQGELPAISYTVVDSASGQSIVAGDLLTEKGSDLFGKRGVGYRHWITENVSFTSKVEKVILEINLQEARLHTHEPGEEAANSYLRMGEAAAVTKEIEIIDQ